MTPSHLAPQTCSVLDECLNGLRTLRLDIATWEKDAYRRAQGWAGENGDRTTEIMRAIASRMKAAIHLSNFEKEDQRARRRG